MAMNNNQRENDQRERQQSQQGDQRERNAGNFAQDRERASEAGKKGAAKTEQRRHQDESFGRQQK